MSQRSGFGSGNAPTELATDMVDTVLLTRLFETIDPSTPSVKPEPCADLIVVSLAGSL